MATTAPRRKGKASLEVVPPEGIDFSPSNEGTKLEAAGSPPSNEAQGAETPPRIAEDLAQLAYPIEKLSRLEGNPNRGDVQAVMRSYRRFGQRKPITARRRADGTEEVTAGNHSLEAARRLGWTEIAVVWTDDDDVTAKAWAVADNRTAQLGVTDEDALAEYLIEIRAGGDGELFAATAYTMADLERMMGHPADMPVGLTDSDEVPEIPPVSISQPGDLWLLGPHRLVHGDSTRLEVVESAMGDRLADMVWTDPPYGVSYVGKSAAALPVPGDDVDAAGLDLMLRGALSNAYGQCRAGAVWYVAGPSGSQSVVFARVLSDLGLLRQTLVWVKDRFVLGRLHFHLRHENLSYGWVEGEHQEPPALADYEDAHGSLMYGWKPGHGHTAPPDRKQDSVWECPRPKVSKDHATQKPVALVERALWNSACPASMSSTPSPARGPR